MVALLVGLLLVVLGGACTSGNHAPGTPDEVLAALRTSARGPLVVELRDGEIALTIAEDRFGNRVFHEINTFHGDFEMRFVDGVVYFAAGTTSSFTGRWVSSTLEEFAGTDVQLTPDADLPVLLEEATLAVFGYTIEECLAMGPVPERQGTGWMVPCAPDIGFVVEFDTQDRITALVSQTTYTATYRYTSPEIVAPVDVLDADEKTAYYEEVRVAAAQLAIRTSLEAMQRSGEARYLTETVSDTQLIDDILRASSTSTVGDVVRVGATALRLTVVDDGFFTCSAMLRFVNGQGAVSDVTCRD